jgi:hypothetical protein
MFDTAEIVNFKVLFDTSQISEIYMVKNPFSIREIFMENLKPAIEQIFNFVANLVFFLFNFLGYWHCRHSWPIVPASGDIEDDCGEADGM